MNAPYDGHQDFKLFTAELSAKLKNSPMAANAAECLMFQIAALPFRRALNLAGHINPATGAEIKRRTAEHIKQAKQRLLMGLYCYVSDAMYPAIEKEPVYVRDLAAVFRMAVFNKAITKVHDELKMFVDIQSDEVILLAVANFEHEHETIHWMRGIHQLAVNVLFKDCIAWYKKTMPTWKPEPMRDLLYVYDVTMYLDTQPVTQPTVCERLDTQHVVNIQWSPHSLNDTLREAFKRYDFMHVEVPSVEYGPLPTFNTIQIAQQTFCRTAEPAGFADQPATQQAKPDPFNALLGQIAKCRVVTTRNIEMNASPLRDKFAALLDKLKC